MTGLPTPEERRRQVQGRIDNLPRDQRGLLRAQLYAETPAEGLLEQLGQEPKSRCAVCWVVRSARLQWKDHQDQHRYTCEHPLCRQLWRRLTRAEEHVHAKAQARLVEAVLQGVAA